jgi:hypothetical protein
VQRVFLVLDRKLKTVRQGAEVRFLFHHSLSDCLRLPASALEGDTSSAHVRCAALLA